MKVADYPGIEQLTRRYQTNDVTYDQVMQTAACIVNTDGRFDRREPQWMELLGRYRFPRPVTGDNAPSLIKNLTDDLVGLMHRPQIYLRHPTPTGLLTYKQCFGHLEDIQGVPRLVPDVTLSSLAIKKENKRGNRFMLRHNANLGAVTCGSEVLAIRSARSDTPSRLLELLLYGAMQQSGRVPGQVHEFRSVIISGLDLCGIKSFFTRFKGKEDEEKVLRDIAQSIYGVFGTAASIDRRLPDGSVVRLRRPILMELPLSMWARVPGNIQASRAYNQPAALQLFDDLAAAWCRRSSACRTLGEQMRCCNSLASRLAFLRSCSVDQRGLHSRERLALESLKLMLLGTDSRGCIYTRPSDPGWELLLLRHLMVEAGLVPCTQCLSGEDRTLTMVSLLTAAHMFERSRAEAYDPREASYNPYHLAELRKLFTEAGVQLGESPIHCVRGLHGRQKWRVNRGPLGHPVPQAMFTN